MFPHMMMPPPKPQRVCADCKVLAVETTIINKKGEVPTFTWMCPNCGKADADPPFDGPVKKY